MYDGKKPLWQEKNWRKWPLDVLGIDQGGDGVSGEHALRYKPNLMLNMMMFYEHSHGCNNDLFAIFKANCKMDYALILLVVMNINHGPDRDEGLRFEEFQDMFRQVVDKFPEGKAYSLFRARCGRILEELADDLPPHDGDDPAEGLWQHLRDYNTYGNIGRRVKKCEWMAWHTGAAHLLKHWTLLLMKAEIWCLEADLLKGKKFLALPVVPEHSRVLSENVDRTSTLPVQVETKVK